MKTVLITGATSGIGFELAKLYAGQGDRLILLGRRPLESLSDPLFTPERYCQVDLSSVDAHEATTEWLADQQISKIDLVIHNAGLGWFGDPAEQSAVSIQELVTVNLETPMRLTHKLLPLLRQASGKLVFVSSVATALATADYTVYTATKTALDGFARSLRIELAGEVDVQVLHPGATRTPMHEKIGITRDRMDYEKFTPASDVAAKMVSAIKGRGKNVAIGFGNKALRTVGRTFPNVLRGVMRKTNDGAGWPASQKSPHVVITGAADGIGRATALRFAQAGYQVTGIDFDPQRSAETEKALRALGVEARFYTADLSDPEAIEQVVTQLGQESPIDVLISNAGISAAGYFAKMPLEQQMKVVAVNFTAPLLLTAALLRDKRLAQNSQLVFLSSLSKYVGYPGAAVYAATKDGLASYGASLHVDGRHPTSSTVVYPGPTRTAHARRYSPDNSREETRTPPDAVAEAVFAGATKRSFVVLPGGGAKMFAFLGRLAPGLMEQAMKKVILEKFDE